MRRVPQNDHLHPELSGPRFLLIGSGRLARHLRYYFGELGIPLLLWSRNGDPEFNSTDLLDQPLPVTTDSLQRLSTLARRVSDIWILTRDSAIEEISQFCQSFPARKFHCSGSLVLSGAFGAHPLMTFGHELYPLSVYPKIPFVTDPETPDLSQISRKILNPQVRMKSKDKPLYHALCVASGNFSVLLWQMARIEFEQLGISWAMLQSYLEATFHNLAIRPDQALTGPLARFDEETIKNNLAALTGHDLGPFYSLFWETYQRRFGDISR